MWDGSEARLTASARLAWPVLGVLRAAGCEVPAVLADAGLSESDIYTPEARIRLRQLYDLWNAAVEATGDDAFGIHVARFFDPASPVSWPSPLALFEHMGRLSPTLADAVTLQSSYLRLSEDGLSCSIEFQGDSAVFRMDFHSGEPAALVEFNLSIAVSVGSRALGRPSDVREVWFTHPAPADVRPHQEAFRAPLRFDAPFNAIISPAAQYREPLKMANPIVLESILRQARAMLDALPSYASFADQVRGQIRDTLPKGNTNASAIAEDLGMSARTLHRRLQAEGISYQELLDQVRLDIAATQLASGRHSIVSIAERVGFSQPSTFHRAFKSWTGLTPAEYQQRHASAEPRPRRDEPGPV